MTRLLVVTIAEPSQFLEHQLVAPAPAPVGHGDSA